MSAVLLRLYAEPPAPAEYFGSSDRERAMLLRAEAELRTLGTIAEHCGLSNIAMDRAWYSLRAIESALDAMRLLLGMVSRGR